MLQSVLTPLFLPGAIGTPELIVIVAIIVLLFGADKLPKLARSAGEATTEFRKAKKEAEQEMQEIEEDIDTEESTESKGSTS